MDEVNSGGSGRALRGHDMRRKQLGYDKLSNGFTLGIYILSFSLFLYLCVTHGSKSEGRHRKQSLKFCLEAQQYGDFGSYRILLNTNASSLVQDMKTLLELKKFLKSHNPYKEIVYQNWHQSDASPCNWSGITCGTVQGFERVTGVNLTGALFQGKIFDGFSTLTALSSLFLGRNSFKGEIPSDLGLCKSLIHLDLSYNFLEGTPNLTGLSNLRVVDLSVNRLNGSISSSFPKNCDNLTAMNLSSNLFTGVIPDTLGNCSNLRFIDLSENQLVGPVWPVFGTMEEVFLCCNNISGHIPEAVFSESCKLRKLDLSRNKLEGTIPGIISNCSDLVLLDLSETNFTGQIPRQFGLMQKLESLILRNINLSRDIPVELTSCKNLSFLDLSGNNFGGRIQPMFGELKGLVYLILHNNLYEYGISAEIFNLPRLMSLDFSDNNFSGPLPVELGSMHSLEFVFLAGNKFHGNIPGELGQLTKLQVLDLSFNLLSGSIPSSLGNLTSLLWLMLENNTLTGPIPSELGKCKSLLWLNLAYNRLSGPLPETLSSMGSNPHDTFKRNAKVLKPLPRQSGACLSFKRWIPANYPPFNFVYDTLNRRSCKQLWDNLLTGKALFPICPKKGKGNVFEPIISGYLQLTGNNLSGSVPKSIGNMSYLSLILFGQNSFDGLLPEEIANPPLVSVNVSFNNFSGSLPISLGGIQCLQSLDLSHNNFRGPIPNSFTNLSELTKFNISYNPLLTGNAPGGGQFSTFEEDSYIGDDLLCFQHLPNMRNGLNNSRPCGSIKDPPPLVTTNQSVHVNSQKPRTILLVVSLMASAVILVCGLLTFSMRKKVSRSNPMEPEFIILKDNNSGGFSPGFNTMHFFRGEQFTFTDILLATANFSESHVIGNGGFGTVYKGKLRNGSTVAVKKLQQKGPEGEKEFLAEMQTLGNHEFHENLVPLLGCCLFGTEKILVYEFMPNGSLEDWLHEKHDGPKRLDWPTRYRIAVGTAKGLKFLHHDCSPVVIHRDMKASNILLDDTFNPHVTDFGLARCLDVEGTHVSTVVAGTVGYVPPEYSQSWRATTKGDVYSYGVVLLELVTGRRPLSVSENSDGNLVEWVSMLISCGRDAEAIDPVLLVEQGEGSSQSSTLTYSSPCSSLCSSPPSGPLSVKYLRQDQLINFLHLGHICTDESPDRRPNIKHVLTILQSIGDA